MTRDRLYIDTMQQVYSNVTKVMIDARSNASLLSLPLDKLLQQAAGGSAAAALPAPSSSPQAATGDAAPATGTVDVRSREGGRSRDRETR